MTCTDNADGTGGVATITGATGSVTVYVSRADGTGFATGGTRSGDGSVALSLTPALWYCWAVNGSATTPLVPLLATLNAVAVHERCLLAVQARIQGLTLDGLDSDQVIDATTLEAAAKNITWPAVVVCIEDKAESQPQELTSRDDIEYPVRVWIGDRADAMTKSRRAQYLLWRQQIFRALRHQRLAGVTEVNTIRVEPMPVILYKLPDFQVVLMGLDCLCLSREPRG